MDFKNIPLGQRIPAFGYAIKSKDSNFEKFSFTRHPMGEKDIVIEILFAGICHSDIHSARSEWFDGIYPMVPGHEIAGRVVATGSKVSKFKVGDYAGVGCMVNSCGECDACKKSQEQFCQQCVFTYNCQDCFHNNEPTYGGYSNNIVVNEHFAVCVPKDAPLDKVAPLLCAGITTYSPLKFSGVKKGDKVAVTGFGGLGVMAVKYALAMGAEVYVFARNRNKEKEALNLGVTKLFDSTQGIKERFNLIISTIPTSYDPMEYINLLKFGGELAIVGLPPREVSPDINITNLVYNAGRKVYGSLIGGMQETQEMLDYSLRHKIYPETEIIRADQIDEAYENLTSGKAKFRYVIDMQTLKD
ncbi:NAD(P)-dependent alcohol dehydrogenase [Helicobacter sp.]|uniref:NAD(P)-dependent alcohol dehydrogenase n=1 Tax=Helicobacter sp. TaxID=218 RepID=UPI0025BDD2C4|nr:NAD(P)-dependent alcohol dehydrogenase [Helicobacter sp.]MCI5968873.1 NAD(P)-dependent alcohol dehydrogenase [Helicobacter sp.]MDY2584991.1 NAD(P)-dependent alcohol dehydrogenase [Helicobacter sp.]